jgi:hypothetical protein
VNAAGIDLAQPVIQPAGLARAGAVSLPALSPQKRAGFLSLLNGLLDQKTATRDVAATRPATRLGATLVPPAAASKSKGESSENATSAALPTVLAQTVPGSIADLHPSPPSLAAATSASRLIEEMGESSAATLVPSAASGDLRTTDAPSGASSVHNNCPSPEQETAFALRLTWRQPNIAATRLGMASGVATMAGSAHARAAMESSTAAEQPVFRAPSLVTVAGSEGVLPKSAGLENPFDGTAPTDQPVGLNDVGDHFAGTSETASRQPRDLELPSTLPLASMAAGSSHPVSFVPERARFPSPETADRTRIANVLAGSSVNPAEAVATVRLDPATEALTAFSAPAAELPISITLQTEGAQASTACSQPDGRPEPVTSQRPPLASSRSVSVAPAGAPATGPGDEENTLERDVPTPESDATAGAAQVTRKAAQMQTGSPPPSHRPAGPWLDRPAVPSAAAPTPAAPQSASVAQSQTATQSAMENSVKTAAPETQPSPAVSPEWNTTTPPAPLREISFRLSADSSNVDVQVAQRAGRIQVSVRTGDPEVAKSLQSNLGELVGRLEAKGFRTETWTPATVQHGGPAREPSGNRQSQPDGSSSGGGKQHPGQSQQESNQRRPGRSKIPWQEALAAPPAKIQEEDQP